MSERISPGNSRQPTPEPDQTAEFEALTSPSDSRGDRMRPDSTLHLDLPMEIRRNAMFIDGRHHAAAVRWLQDQGVSDPETQKVRLHEYYLESRSTFGRFPDEAWDYFNRAQNYVEERALAGEALDVGHILATNALIQFGAVPDNPASIIRKSHDVMGVLRDTRDVQQVFDERGRYLTTFPNPPMEGFMDKRYFHVQMRGQQSPADLLLELKEQNPSRERVFEIREAIRAQLKQDPHSVNDKHTYIIFSTSATSLGAHLNAVVDQYRRDAKRIIQEVQSGQLAVTGDASDYIRSVNRLAVHLGSTVDMGHFAMDGMGRTNVRLEQWVQMNFGLLPPVPVSVRFLHGKYENGSYVPKEIRVHELSRRMKPPKLEMVHRFLERLEDSLAKTPSRLTFGTDSG